MIEQLRKTAGYWVLALGIVLVGVLSGCETGPKNPDVVEDVGTRFHIGDVVGVTLVPQSGENVMTSEQRIGEDGSITLLYIGQVTATNKTASQLQREIHNLYVPKFYTGMNVVVKGDTRYFFVDGEVRSPGNKELPGDMTVVKAISMAGGFTDFANKKKVQVTHAGKKKVVNYLKAIDNPDLDVPVYPGDKILVPRRPF
jgi:polysaccharide export outer membrane protein